MSVPITRRQAIGAGGVALLYAGVKAPGLFGPDVVEAAQGQCIMTPAKTVGPYFVDERLNRSDVRSSTTGDTAPQPGVPLTLNLQVFDVHANCAPVRGAVVDIWHANAEGVYSDQTSEGTPGVNWLRGLQATDADGLATFVTIYPGWYRGRAVHIHFKVRLFNGSDETLDFTSQLFFTDDTNNAVFAANAPYKDRSPMRPDTTDGADGIYGSDGSSLLLTPAADPRTGGYTADFSVGIRGGGAASTPPADAPGDTAVGGRLLAARMVRDAAGTRRLRLTLKITEPLTLSARLTRGSRTLARRRTTLKPGRRTLTLRVPDDVPPGGAKLALTLSDSAGATAVTRVVHVRRRRS